MPRTVQNPYGTPKPVSSVVPIQPVKGQTGGTAKTIDYGVFAPATRPSVRSIQASAPPASPSPGSTLGTPGAKSPQTYFVDTPSGTLGYSSEQWDPVHDAQGNVTGVKPKEQSSGQTVSNKQQLDEQFQNGTLSQFQYDSALSQLNRGATGVDPAGMASGSRAEQIRSRLAELQAPLERMTNAGVQESDADVASRQAANASEAQALEQELSMIGTGKSQLQASVAPLSSDVSGVSTNQGSVTPGAITRPGDVNQKTFPNLSLFGRSQERGQLRNFGDPGLTQDIQNAQNGIPSAPSAAGQSAGTGGSVTAPGGGESQPGALGGMQAPTGTMDFALASLPPEMQQQIAPLLQYYGQQGMNAYSAYQQARQDISQDKSLVDLFYEDGKSSAIESRNKAIEVQGKLDDLDRAYANETQRKQIAESVSSQALFDAQTHHAAFIQEQDNIDTEKQNRLIAAKTGGNYDTSGLDWMQRQVQRGTEALTNIFTQAAVGDKQFGDQRVGIINNFGLTIRDINQKSQLSYDKIFSDYNGEISTLRKDRILDKQKTRDKERQLAKDYYDALAVQDKAKGDLYMKAIDTMNTHAEKVATTENDNTKWKADYEFKVQKEKNDMAFNEQKFQSDYQQKALELSQKGEENSLKDWENQFNLRTKTVGDLQSQIHNDRSVAQYESTYYPAWDNFNSALKLPEGTYGRNDTIGKAFNSLIGGAQAADPGILYNLSIGRLGDPGKVPTDDEVLQMGKVADTIFSRAQTRRNDSITHITKDLPRINTQFTNDFFKIKSQDLGIATPLDSERQQILNTLPDATKSSFNLQSGERLSDDHLLSMLQSAGFTGDGLKTAYAVARAESGGRPLAYNGNANTGDKSYGIFQINMLGALGPDRTARYGLKGNDDLFDPLTNAKIAYKMSNGGTSWGPWSAYKNGSYKKYLS